MKTYKQGIDEASKRLLERGNEEAQKAVHYEKAKERERAMRAWQLSSALFAVAVDLRTIFNESEGDQT